MDNWKQDWARLRGYTASSRTHSTEVKKILERSPPFDLFIDCGPGNVGSEAWSVRDAMPDCEIIGFEPQTERYKMLMSASYPGKLMPYAVGRKTEQQVGYMGYENGKSDFWIRADKIHLSKDAYKKTEISVVALQDFLTPEQQSKNIFIWADIEGAERDMLMGAAQLFKKQRIVGVMLEIHTEKSYDFVAGQGTPSEIKNMLRMAGLEGSCIKGGGTHSDWLYTRTQ